MSGLTLATTPLCISPVGPAALGELAQALDQAGLPSADLDGPKRWFFRFADAGAVIGFGGLEGGPRDQLLRSVVVYPGHRHCGRGSDIVRALEAQAAVQGCARLHLLTTTAAPLFLRLGYQLAAREAAPPVIASTRQFVSLCPASAQYLVKTLAGA